MHITYQGELFEDDPIRIETQLVSFNRKRFHWFQQMRHGESLKLAATCEWMILFIDMNKRKVAEMPDDIFDLMQQYTLFTLQLPIYDEHQNVINFEPVTKDVIQGDYHVTVAVGSSEIKNQQGLIEQIGFLLQALQPYAGAGVINIKPLLEQLLSLMPELKDIKAIVGDTTQAPGGMPPPPGAPPGPGGPEAGGAPPGDFPPELIQALMQGAPPMGLEG
jgi:hypothetical protein